MESEVGRVRCTVFGGLASSLQPKERVRSVFVARLETSYCLKTGYRDAADSPDVALHRRGGNEIRLMTLRDCMESTAGRIDRKVDALCASTLAEGGFDPDTLGLVEPDRLPDGAVDPACPGEDGRAAEEWEARARRLADDSDKNRPEEARIPLEGLADAVEQSADRCVYVSVDDVGVRHQKDGRKDGGSKSRKNVENTVTRVECAEGACVLTRVGMDSALGLLLSFLLSNGLTGNRRLVFFSDGAQNIRCAVERYFSFRPCTLMLDWYHLEKRMRELCSMALKGTRDEKHEMRDTLDAMLWVGNVDGAIEYLREMDAKHARNRQELAEATGYLERKRPWICCYAIRKLLGLRNSSNPAEKENDLVVATRQKHNGTGWSFGGSHALATIAAAKRNGEIDGWLTDRSIRFTPRPRQAEQELMDVA